MFRRRRGGVFRRKPAYRRKRVYRRRRRVPKLGGFIIRRRIPTFGITGNQLVAGSMSSGNTTVLDLGTPQAAAGGAGNFYDVPFAITFYLNQLDTSSDITNIADKYRIISAMVKLCGHNIGSTGFSMPWVEYVADHDDNSVPSLSQLTQKMGVRNVGFNQQGQLTMRCKPLPAPSVYNGVSTAYAVPRRSMFINSSYDGVPHYSLKGILRNVYLNGSGAATNFTVDIQLTVHAKDLQ